jgi:hypothetical protein
MPGQVAKGFASVLQPGGAGGRREILQQRIESVIAELARLDGPLLKMFIQVSFEE